MKLQRLTHKQAACAGCQKTPLRQWIKLNLTNEHTRIRMCVFKARTNAALHSTRNHRLSFGQKPVLNFYEINIRRVTRSGDRIPKAKFYTPVQTGLGIHPASYTMGTGSLARGEGGSGRGMALTTHTSSAEVKEGVELNLYFPSGPSLPVRGVKWNRVLRVQYIMFFVSAPQFPTTSWNWPLCNAHTNVLDLRFSQWWRGSPLKCID
jgi:hypothetical protein